jgi:hypothetical protein
MMSEADPGNPPAGPTTTLPADTTPGRPSTPRSGRPTAAVVAIVAVVAILLVGAIAWAGLAPDPVRAMPAWDALDDRWGTYLSEREWGTPREAVGGNGWGLDYLDAIRTDYRFGEDGIAGLTTREGEFAIGWAVWDGRQVRVTERFFGWSNPAGPNGEEIVDRRTFGPNTPTSSYHRLDMEYPNKERRFAIAFEGARVDDTAGIVRATATNTGADPAPLDLVLKGWFHDTDREVELTTDGLLLRGPGTVVAIVGPTPTSAQVSAEKRALDRDLRAGGLTATGPGHIGALAYRLDLAAGATGDVTLAWAEATDADAAAARARELLPEAARVVGARRDEADGLYRDQVTAHEDLYRQALASTLWSQSLYTWDGTSSYDPAWDGRVNARDVLVMPDKWEFPWLATWDLGFHAVTAALADPEIGADQLRFLLSDRWQQPDGALPCAEWIMAKDCPPVFAWAAWRVAELGAGTDFLREVYPGLVRHYDYWWAAKAVEPAGLFTWGTEEQGFTRWFRPGMDNLPWGVGQAQADATGFMAQSARDLARIAEAIGDAEGAARFAADYERIAAAANANLWDENAGFYFDRDESGESFIPTKSYSGLIPLVAGIVPADRLPRVLEALRDPEQLLSPHGVRSVSAKSVIYQPGYAKEQGVNSNWRGPIWLPLSYLVVEALDDADPDLATTIRERLVATVEADWQATGRFHEYFHAETGEGLGADAQAGWTAIVANLIAEGWPAPTE